MEEINDWVPMNGYEGLYEVSGILGKVRSLNYNHTGRAEIMTGKHNKGGYVDLEFWKNGEVKTLLEHRIVAEHFRPNPFNKPCVNHINEIKDDNRACNLEWVTYEENNKHGTRLERVSKTQLNDIRKSKPVLQFTLDGEFVREWPSVMECGRNGFQFTHVSACCRGKLKSHKGYIWKFKGEA